MEEQQEQVESSEIKAGAPDDARFSRLEERLEEVLSKNKNLTELLDMKERLDENEQKIQKVQQQAQAGAEANPDADWNAWMAPKIAPFLQERDRVILMLADELDLLKTEKKFPEFEDPEYAQSVNKFIREVKKNRGIVLSRTDAIIQLKGLEATSGKSANEGAGKTKTRTTVSSPVESSAGIGTTRAAQDTNNKNPEDMSIEEMEKAMRGVRI